MASPAAAWKIRVPASSANLGPGFDALGLALSVYLRCRFRRADKLKIVVRGRDAGLISSSEDNFIWQTALGVARDVGAQLEPVELEIDNDIPLGKGLGSSAAALTAGVVIANVLLELGWKPLRVLGEAARIEGHPDNAAASVLVFYERGCEEVCYLVRQIFSLHGRVSEVMLASVATEGYSIEEDSEPWR